MKRADVKPGVVAMLSLGRRGSIRVTVIRAAMLADIDERPGAWVCEDANGRYRTATARQLSPCPVTSRDGALLGYVGPREPGQTIDAGDVVITTTLQRLG